MQLSFCACLSKNWLFSYMRQYAWQELCWAEWLLHFCFLLFWQVVVTLETTLLHCPCPCTTAGAHAWRLLGVVKEYLKHCLGFSLLPCVVQGSGRSLAAKHFLFNSRKPFHLPVDEAQRFCHFSRDTLFYGSKFSPSAEGYRTEVPIPSLCSILPKKLYCWHCYQAVIAFPFWDAVRQATPTLPRKAILGTRPPLKLQTCGSFQ